MSDLYAGAYERYLENRAMFKERVEKEDQSRQARYDSMPDPQEGLRAYAITVRTDEMGAAALELLNEKRQGK